MADFGDDFWNRPKRAAKDIVAEHMARLTFTEKTEPPKQVQPPSDLYMGDAERLVEHDRRYFLDGDLGEAEHRQRELGIWVPRGTGYQVGDDGESQ